MSILNDRIKQRRLSLNLTLLQVAEQLGVKEATVQRYESGDIKNIKHETIAKLAEILGCSPSYLMGWKPDVSQASDFVISNLERQIITEFREADEVSKAMVLRSLSIDENQVEKGDMSKMA